jgi:transposase
MAKPIPRELRQRVVDAYGRGEGTYEDVAARFMVGRATVSRWLGLERRTGSVEPKAMGGKRHEYIIGPDGEAFLNEILLELPDTNLAELADAFDDRFGQRPAVRTMGRALHRMGLSRKRGL